MTFNPWTVSRREDVRLYNCVLERLPVQLKEQEPAKYLEDDVGSPGEVTESKHSGRNVKTSATHERPRQYEHPCGFVALLRL